MVDIPLNNFHTDWYPDLEFARVRSGHAYAYTSITALTRSGVDEVAFKVTKNPYELVKAERRKDRNVYACQIFWVEKKSPDPIIDRIDDMFARINQTGFWKKAQIRYIRPTISFCAKKSGLEGIFHEEFSRKVLAIETEILRNRMINAGVDPVDAKKYRVV